VAYGRPVGYQQSVELRLRAVVEGQNEFGSVRPESLQRVGYPRREVPQITLFHVGDVGPAGGDPASRRMLTPEIELAI
jgi:hypothetical protein